MMTKSSDAFGFEAIGEERKGLDLSGFTRSPGAAIDRPAAEAAREVADAAGFQSRGKPASPRRAGQGRANPPGKVKISDLIGRPDVPDEPRAQLNMMAPASLIVRFKKIEHERGVRAWEVLKAALDALEGPEQ